MGDALTRMKKGQSAMEYLMTYGWALLVIVIVIAVLLYINPFKAPEQCIFDQAGFLCTKPILMSSGSTVDGTKANVLHATVTNGQRSSIVVTQVMCLSSRLQPPSDPATWPSDSAQYGTVQVTKTLGYQDSFDLGNFTDDSGSSLYVQCIGADKDSTGNFQPKTVSSTTLRSGDSFSGRLYIAYRDASDPESTPSKIVGANLVTAAQ